MVIILFYEVVVWWPAMYNSLCKERFKRKQRMAEVCITGSLRVTPSDALDFILDLLPVKLMGAKIATLAAIRLREANLWTYWLDIHHVMPEGGTEYCIPVEQLTINCIVAIPFREQWDAQTPVQARQ